MPQPLGGRHSSTEYRERGLVRAKLLFLLPAAKGLMELQETGIQPQFIAIFAKNGRGALSQRLQKQ